MKAIKVLPDFQCYPLWHYNDEKTGNINPLELGISIKLSKELISWSEEYDKTYNKKYPPNSKFSSKDIEIRFVEKGKQLSQKLKSELNNKFKIIYYDIIKNKEIVI